MKHSLCGQTTPTWRKQAFRKDHSLRFLLPSFEPGPIVSGNRSRRSASSRTSEWTTRSMESCSMSCFESTKRSRARWASPSQSLEAVRTSSRLCSRACSFGLLRAALRKCNYSCQDWIRFGLSSIPVGMMPRIASNGLALALRNSRSRPMRSKPNSNPFGKPSGQGQ